MGADLSGVRYVWQNGRVKPFAEATIHVLSNAVFAAASVFEGLRGYWNEEQGELYLFRLAAHSERLRESAHLMRFALPYPPEEYAGYIRDLVQANEFKTDIHMLQTISVEGFGGFEVSEPVGMWIAARPRGRYSDAAERGLDVTVSSWTRISDHAVPPRIKCSANYQNSRLATLQARADGYDGAILLNDRGTVAEGPGANVFIVRRGRVVTPPATSGILDGITRATLIELFAREHGLTVEEREIDRTELPIADEAFFCGSGAEVSPIVSVDRLPIGRGRVGPITRAIQDTYMQVVRGRHPAYRHWLTPIYQAVAVPA